MPIRRRESSARTNRVRTRIPPRRAHSTGCQAPCDHSITWVDIGCCLCDATRGERQRRAQPDVAALWRAQGAIRRRKRTTRLRPDQRA
jgi:hypothetical protein